MQVHTTSNGEESSALSSSDNQPNATNENESALLTDPCEQSTARREPTDFKESYQSIIESLPVIVYLVEPKPPFAPIYVSPSIAALGYPLDEWYRDDGLWQRILHTEDRERVFASVEQSMSSGRETDCEYRVMAADGGERWLHDRGHFVFDEKGMPACWQRVMLDITERKAAETRYKQVVDSATDIIYCTDAEGCFNFVNPTVVKILGYTESEFLQLHYRDIIVPEDRETVEGYFRKQIETKQSHAYFEFAALTKDGSKVWLGQNVQLINEGKRIVGLQSIARDITEQKATEQALSASEERFKLVARATNDVLREWNLVTNEVWWNEGAEKSFGYEGKQVSHFMWWHEHIHPEDRGRVVGGISAAIEARNDFWSDEYRLRRQDETYAYVYDRGYFVHDERKNPVRMIASLMDVTERKTVDETIRQSNEYRNLFNLANDAILIFEPQGGIVLDVNDKACEVYGIERDLFIGRNLKRMATNMKAGNEQLLMLLAKGTCQEFETMHTRGDGTPINLLINASVIEYQGRRAILSINRDITDRKRAEEAIRESENQLRQAQKMDAIGQLAGGVAHDFNNILGVIKNRAELALRRAAPDHPLHRHVEEIDHATDRAAALTRQLLAFSSKQVLQPLVLDLNSVVEEMNRMLRRLIGENIELETQLDAERCTIKIDPSQIEQVVMNLVINARDAMAQGGKLRLETKNILLNASSAAPDGGADGSYVLLTVTDNGCGMDAKTRERIFEPFFTTKGIGKGTGLGLATVYGIVKQSNGEIVVISEPGVGTTFEIYLPRVTDKVSERVEDISEAEVPGGWETILLVEDEQMLREVTRESLEMNGYHVLEAFDGMEAIRVGKEYNGTIHLLLSDVVMPRLGGPDLVSRLSKLRPNVKVLYMSGYTEEGVVQHGILNDEVSFLKKPFKSQSLMRKLRDLLDTA